jgi:hypothetical protein
MTPGLRATDRSARVGRNPCSGAPRMEGRYLSEPGKLRELPSRSSGGRKLRDDAGKLGKAAAVRSGDFERLWYLSAVIRGPGIPGGTVGTGAVNIEPDTKDAGGLIIAADGSRASSPIGARPRRRAPRRLRCAAWRTTARRSRATACRDGRRRAARRASDRVVRLELARTAGARRACRAL